MSLRAAVIGCGAIGSLLSDDPRIQGVYSHAQAYQVCPATALAAVCDPDPARREACARRWGAPRAYADAAELMARERPKLVSICSPDPTHYDLALLALDSPGLRGILMEKPIALTLDQARTVVERAGQKGVALAVNYIRRYAPGFQELKAYLAGGVLGDLQALTGFYTKGVFHSGTHLFDLVRLLAGPLAGEVVSVQGQRAPDLDQPDPGLDLVLEFASGLRGFIHACDHRAHKIFELDLVGTLGRARVIGPLQRTEISFLAPDPYYSGFRCLTPDHCRQQLLTDVILHAVADLARCVEQGGRPLCAGDDGLAALAIAQAALDSARSGRAARPGA